ncbi:hypothetical protein OJF2_34310 [Aquisphaera giovannonii]|uniref:Uncharacterized protein n=1 Tax=Aquisphaera giovannonii TaxID=406548 RepID=A0A5B9W2R1_9BACT|nr:hypothetical protein [Aquisphaera giovannonii]QEH34886.1 hypothetical protein OJF2_34310 [Aquisphaera giovannonii]
MTEREWQACRDPEPMLRQVPAARHQRELRLFGAACARRVWRLLPGECRAAVEASERFAGGEIGGEELEAAVARAAEVAAAAFPGHSAPDAASYATSAAVDASSAWPRTATNVMAAASCAASAAGCDAGEADEARYDEAFERARRGELAAQADLLRALIAFPGEPPPA